MPFNETKCVLMHFAKRNKPIQSTSYHIGSTPLTTSNSHKDLGILLQNNLNWSSHLNLVCSKAYKTLYLLKRCFSTSIPCATKKRLYISLIRSQLSFCSQLWRPMLIRDIKKMESVQRRATKFIIGSSSTSDYKSRLVHLHLLPLMYYYELADIMFMVNSLKNRSPSNHFDILSFVDIQASNTRSSDKISLKHTLSSTKFDQQFYFNRVPRLWNKLPSIDLSPSSNTIKLNLHKYLWSHFLENFDPNITCSFHFSCPCGNCLGVN